MNPLLPILLLSLAPQDWRAHQLPDLSVPPADPLGAQILGTGSHIALNPDRHTDSKPQEASLAPSLLTQLIAGHFSRSELNLVPGSNPLLVRATPKEHQELSAILDSFNDDSERLQIRLHVALLPGVHDSFPLDSRQAGDSAPQTSGTIFKGEIRSGDSVGFGTRMDRAFIGGYEVEVATDAGVADPSRSYAKHGETIHLLCSRISKGQAVHVSGLLDLSQLIEIKTFDPDTPDLGEIEQPRISICQIAFSGVATEDKPVRVVIRGSETFGERTLLIKASTQEDAAPPQVGWAVRDLAFLSSEGLPLSPPTPGLRPYHPARASIAPTYTPTRPGALIGLLSDRASLGTDVGRVHSTERLLLIPVNATEALAKTDALIAAMESPLLAQNRLTVRHGETSVDLPTTRGRLARVLIADEQPWLVDYLTEIASTSWMPNPVTEVSFDGVCLEGRVGARAMQTRWWMATTPSFNIATSRVANLGAIQHVERAYAAGSERLERSSARVIAGLDSTLELMFE